MGTTASLNSNIDTNIDIDSSGNSINIKVNSIIEPPKKVEIMERDPILEKAIIKIPDRELMEKLENEGMKKTAELWNKSTPFHINSLMDIMKEGTDEFKKKEGRNMTYSEMRSLYG
jgi:hypothetical protein